MTKRIIWVSMIGLAGFVPAAFACGSTDAGTGNPGAAGSGGDDGHAGEDGDDDGGGRAGADDDDDDDGPGDACGPLVKSSGCMAGCEAMPGARIDPSGPCVQAAAPVACVPTARGVDLAVGCIVGPDGATYVINPTFVPEGFRACTSAEAETALAAPPCDGSAADDG